MSLTRNKKVWRNDGKVLTNGLLDNVSLSKNKYS
jgi:hypothetical protein